MPSANLAQSLTNVTWATFQTIVAANPTLTVTTVSIDSGLSSLVFVGAADLVYKTLAADGPDKVAFDAGLGLTATVLLAEADVLPFYYATNTFLIPTSFNITEDLFRVIDGRYDFSLGDLLLTRGTTFPLDPQDGQIFWNQTDKLLYVYDGGLAQWVSSVASAPVLSVNGETGVVVLDAADVGADSAGTGATEAAAAVATHEGLPDPHPQYTTSAEAAAAAPVQSVNAQTGAVVLTAADVSADPAGTAAAAVAAHEALTDPHPQYTTAAEATAAAPVQSVNAETGAVVLDAADVGADAAGTAAAAVATHEGLPDPHPQYTTAAEATAAAPVQSVNAETGAVVLDAADVGADPAGAAAAAVTVHEGLPDPHPQYTTAAEAAAAAPVQSVNGETGAVVLDAADVGADPTGAAAAAVAAHESLPDPHPQYQLESEKGVANGYASLDADAALVEPATSIRETSGPTNLVVGAISDGEALVRSGGSVVGTDVAALSAVLGIVLVSPGSAQSFGTIAAALSAASNGDVVILGPGSYAENVVVPEGVTLEAAHGVNSARITGTGTGARVTLSNRSSLREISVTAPNSANSAIVSNATTVAYLEQVSVIGAGGTGASFRSDGTGVVLINGFFHEGDAQEIIYAAAGQIQVQNLVYLTGVVESALRSAGFIRTRGFRLASASSVTNGLRLDAGGEILMSDGLVDGVTNGIRVTGDGTVLNVNDSKFRGTSFDFLADAGVTTGVFEGQNVNLRETASQASAAYFSTAAKTLQLVSDTPGDEGTRMFGELAIGRPEEPRELVVGEGDSTSRGQIVFTTDGTASPSSDGGNFQDVSGVAGIVGGGTFSFQGDTAGHSIIIGSVLQRDGVVVKHWGYKHRVVTGAVEVTPRSFVHEIWTSSGWVEVGKMAINADTQSRYADAVFLRSGTSEQMRYGVRSSTTWDLKTINGVEAYWSRIRIINDVTTAPVFDQFKLSTNRAEFNGDGGFEAHGLARYEVTVQSTGNVFGETGGVGDFAINVGSGGLPTGWAHTVKNSELNSNGDAITIQFALPLGIDTSFPLETKVVYVKDDGAGTSVDCIISSKVSEVAGILIADPAGGTAPVARAAGTTEAFDAAPGSTSGVISVDTSFDDRFQEFSYDGTDIQSYYEGDVVKIRVELDDDGAPNVNLGVFLVNVSGVAWTLGGKLI